MFLQHFHPILYYYFVGVDINFVPLEEIYRPAQVKLLPDYIKVDFMD